MRFRALVLWSAVSAAVFAQASENEIRKSIVRTALSFKGVPYVYGASSPSAFDCSGFVSFVYRKAVGIAVPRTSKALFASGLPIQPAKVKPGDVLVFDTVGGAPSHVAIVLDEGSMIHAASSGPQTGVIVSPLSDRYFAPRLIGARVYVASPVEPLVPAVPAAAAPAAPKTPQAKPAPAAAAPAKQSPAADEPVVSSVGFSITESVVVYADKIPAAVGTAVQFAVKNETGADGVFEILFYKMDKDPSKARTIRRDRIGIRAGGMTETEPILFSEPGQYKLILKTHDNIKRVERVWKVVAVK